MFLKERNERDSLNKRPGVEAPMAVLGGRVQAMAGRGLVMLVGALEGGLIRSHCRALSSPSPDTCLQTHVLTVTCAYRHVHTSMSTGPACVPRYQSCEPPPRL